MRKRLAAELPPILDCFLEQASKGSIAHMKVLLALSGMEREVVKPARVRTGGRRFESLSERLWAELQKTPGMREEE